MDKQISLSFAVRVRGLRQGLGTGKDDVCRVMIVRYDSLGPSVEAPSTAGMKQSTEMPAGVCV